MLHCFVLWTAPLYWHWHLRSRHLVLSVVLPEPLNRYSLGEKSQLGSSHAGVVKNKQNKNMVFLDKIFHIVSTDKLRKALRYSEITLQRISNLIKTVMENVYILTKQKTSPSLNIPEDLVTLEYNLKRVWTRGQSPSVTILLCKMFIILTYPCIVHLTLFIVPKW